MTERARETKSEPAANAADGVGARPSSAQVIEWVDTLSNWGRWGADDHLGTLNYVTEETRRAATALVRHGQTVSCSWEIPATSGRSGLAGRYMVNTGESATPGPHRHYASEVLEVEYHGGSVTHLDALSHVFWGDRMYNGKRANLVNVASGAASLGIETIPGGIVTRGVLLDVARYLGTPCLPLTYGVMPDELDATARSQNVEVRSGDAVLLHTGLSGHRRRSASWSLATDGAPAWQAACLPWMHDHEVALIGTDAINDVFPNQYPELGGGPIHAVGIPAMGLWLIDNCDLEELARVCAERQQWEFLLVVSPLRFRGATGIPVNPIAML